MLFVLASEDLTLLFLCAQVVGYIGGFQVSRLGEGLPIVQFTKENTLIFVDGSCYCQKSFNMVRCFSGLKVNPDKTEFFLK